MGETAIRDPAARTTSRAGTEKMNRTIELKAAKSLRCKDVALGEPRSADAYHYIPALCFMALPSKGARGTMITDTHLFWFVIGFFVGAVFSEAFLSLVTLLVRSARNAHDKSIHAKRCEEVEIIIEYKINKRRAVARKKIWPRPVDEEQAAHDGRPNEKEHAVSDRPLLHP